MIAEFQARSAALSAALEQADVPVLDSLVAPGFAATLGLDGGAVFYVPRSSWLRQPQEIAGLEAHVIIARRQGDTVFVTSLRGPQLRPRYLVTDVWSRAGVVASLGKFFGAIAAEEAMDFTQDRM